MTGTNVSKTDLLEELSALEKKCLKNNGEPRVDAGQEDLDRILELKAQLEKIDAEEKEASEIDPPDPEEEPEPADPAKEIKEGVRKYGNYDKLNKLIDHLLADRNTVNDLYQTGMANGLMLGRSTVFGDEYKPIKPLDAPLADKPVPLTDRVLQIKELGKYVKSEGGFRSGLQPGDEEKAKVLLKQLGVKVGSIRIPTE